LDTVLHVSANQKYRQKKALWASGKSNDGCVQGGYAHSGGVTERSHFKSAEWQADQIATRPFRVAMMCVTTHKNSRQLAL
jgi:hypothetical protein